jgi:hypothetical protein
MFIQHWFKVLACSILWGLLVACPYPVMAQEVSADCQDMLQYMDLDGDGQAEAMVLSCKFSPTTNDTLTIYKGSETFLTDIPWQQNIAYEDEIWIFDHESNGKSSLIIKFRRDGGELVAEIYDDRNRDGEVRYEIQDGQIIVTEILYWTVKIVAPDGWWIRDDELNYNLIIQVDGDVEGMFMMSPYRSSLQTDGSADYDIQIYDRNHNGRPEFDKRMILTPFLQQGVGLQTQMMANWRDDELPISGGFSLWPYLDLKFTPSTGSNVGKDYHSTSPPIKFAPSTGWIEAIGEFVASRAGEHNCFYYSATDWVIGRVNQADFENPFCFYDLAQDGDRIPEMQVRAEYWYPNDWYFMGGNLDEPYEMIRYSWDQANEQTWRYAVGLVGRHMMDSIVTMAGLDVFTIPYDEFPTWVTRRTWDMAVFSEFTGKSYFTGEGDYSVSYVADSSFAEYFTGKSDQKPSPEYAPAVNFRMEWAMDYARQPYLYFSPVDRRLHLLGATGGLWNIDKNQSIQYENIGGGDFINRWTYRIDGRPQKSLLIINPLVLLSEANTLTIQLSNIPPSQFITLPPATHGEWLNLGALLLQNQQIFAPDDFISMAGQFSQPVGSIEGASIRGMREVKGGIRFVLNLHQEFRVIGEDQLNLRGRNPGEYAVIYDGTFHVQPMTPTAIQLTLPNSPLVDGLLIEYIDNNLWVTVRNDGLEDAQNVMVMLGTSQAGGKITWSAPQTVTVLAGENIPVRFQWVPPSDGEWMVQVWANLLDPGFQEGDIKSIEQVVFVQPAESTSLTEEISTFGLIAHWQFTLLLTTSLIIPGLTVWVLTRMLMRNESSPELDSD